MMNKRTLLILEIAWLIIGVLCIIAAAHNKIASDGSKFLIFLLMGVAAVVMSRFRHNQRKKN